jgi:endonuclease V-like protein UPF0215 family
MPASTVLRGVTVAPFNVIDTEDIEKSDQESTSP